jgi:S1-C subfamily serine protease
MKRLWIVLSVLVLSAMACQMAGVTPVAAPPSPVAVATAVQSPITLPPASNLSQQQDLLVAMYQQVTPGVVAIRVVTDQGSALGSGFVFDNAGHIITNFHVVEGATQVEVDFTSGLKTFGTVVGTDLDSDIAVVKVDVPADQLFPLTLGDSNQLQVGQTVVAIGNPFGLSGTMTSGIISALGRTLDSQRSANTGGFFTAGDVIQTDAAINPGNSGGPLFNLQGNVIGINRAIRTTNYTDTGEPLNSGIGFAVSINIVKRVVPVLIKDGKYDYPYMGITTVDDLGLAEIQTLNLKSNTGAYVLSVTNGSPADKAGVKAGDRPSGINGLQAGGDLIVAIDGQTILHFDELLKYLINNKMPGDTVTLTVLRGDQKVDIPLTLGKRP